MRHRLEVVRLSIESFVDQLHFQSVVATSIGLKAGIVVALMFVNST